MSLKVIKGPPNSGRTELVRRRYMELLPRNPVLVVPGVDDIFGWERRLTDGTGALVGGQILHFNDLYGEILSLARSERPGVATELHRQQLIRQAIDSGWKTVARRIPDQPGLTESVLGLIDDFRAENIDPATLESRIAESGLRHLRPLADVYREYINYLDDGSGLTPGRETVRDQVKPTDSPNEATLAVRLVGSLWSSRPVMIAGFDELTRQQLETVRRLAFEVGVEVTVAVTYEPDNPALALTADLVADLLNLGPEGEVSTTTTRREDSPRPHDRTLLEVEKRFMRPVRAGDTPLEPSEAVTVMRSAGARNEAEAIAAEVARLIADDVPPGEIAVGIEAPGRHGRILRDTLERFRIPVTLEAETGAADTVTGQALLNLLKACGTTGSVAALLAFLRSPAGLNHGCVDRLERRLRIRGIESAATALKQLDRPPPALLHDFVRAIADGQPIADLAARAAMEISLAVLAADRDEIPSAATAIETQTGSAIGRACREIGELRRAREQPAAIIEFLESGVVKVWAVPAAGTVRIASPYSLRAKRLGYLFCAALQESGLVDTDRAGPFLSVRERSALGMSPRRDPEIQQRYLFYSNLSVPTKRLWLSCRTSDETGKVEHPSPLIAAVEQLFEQDREGEPLVNRGGRTGSEIVFQPADSPGESELARSLAASGSTGDDLPAAMELDEDLARAIKARLRSAAAAESRTRRLGSLELSAVLEALGDKPVLGATEIESYAGCPYRWFIERQLAPQPFEPDPDHLATGNLMHAVLEDLYGSHPGEIPREATIGSWLGEVRPLVELHSRSPRIGLGSDSAGHRALRSRVIQLLSAHLSREAGQDSPRHLPARLEAQFGTDQAELDVLDMGGWWLKGKIDRIDLSPETPVDIPREAIVIDYKSGSVENLTWKKAEKERKRQIQLYLHAVRELFGANPVAGVYLPLRADGKPARGAFDAELADEMKARGVAGQDQLESLDSFVAEGLELARDDVGRMLAGILDHDPATCPNHLDHPAVPDRAVDDANPAGSDR